MFWSVPSACHHRSTINGPRLIGSRPARHVIRFSRPRKDTRRLATQHVRSDSPKLVGGAHRAAGERLIREQCEEQQGPANLRLVVINARRQPPFLDQIAHLRREERGAGVSRLEFVDRLRQVGQNPGLVDLKVLEQQADVVARLLEQFHEPVLDLDIVIGSRQAKPSRPLERPLADGIEFADQPLEIETSHARSSFSSRRLLLHH